MMTSGIASTASMVNKASIRLLLTLTVALTVATVLVVSLRSAVADERLEVIARHAHDPNIFTQGLALTDGLLYQSSGLRGRSAVTVSSADSTDVIHRYQLPWRYFGEGLTVVDDDIMVLTWQAETLLVLDKNNLQLKRTLTYQGEGWGLAWDGRHLLRSDGSDRITWHDPNTMAVIRHLKVRDTWGAVRRLNELEWVQGIIFANIWKSERLIAIDPASGRVLAEWDLAPLLPSQRQFGAEAVANGIAYDQRSGHFWLTGKGWPIIYEVKLHAAALAQP